MRALVPRLGAVAIAWVATLAIGIARVSAADIPPDVDQYAAALAKIEHTRGRQSLEDVFELGLRSGPRLEAILESLSDADFKALREKMAGFVIERGPVTTVHPSSEFFRKLARKKGTKIDREFFEIYARTEPDSNGGLPAYIERRTDESRCTRFDGPLMTSLYRGWLSFRTAHPEDYATEAQGEIDSLTTELQAGTCACGTKEQVIAALEAFVKAFPDVPIAPELRRRIERVHHDSSHIRFNCQG
jgi:hypothetical protein